MSLTTAVDVVTPYRCLSASDELRWIQRGYAFEGVGHVPMSRVTGHQGCMDARAEHEEWRIKKSLRIKVSVYAPYGLFVLPGRLISSPEVIERELRALTEAGTQYPNATRRLLTLTQDGLPEHVPQGIVAQPAYEWLLMNSLADGRTRT